MVHSQPQMTVSGNNRFFPLHWLAIIALSVVLLIGAATLYAQIEGNRGIAPVASSGDFEVNGILVDATGKNSLEARENAWREAQRKGWAKLWRETNCSSGAPALSDLRWIILFRPLLWKKKKQALAVIARHWACYLIARALDRFWV